MRSDVSRWCHASPSRLGDSIPSSFHHPTTSTSTDRPKLTAHTPQHHPPTPSTAAPTAPKMDDLFGDLPPESTTGPGGSSSSATQHPHAAFGATAVSLKPRTTLASSCESSLINPSRPWLAPPLHDSSCDDRLPPYQNPPMTHTQPTSWRRPRSAPPRAQRGAWQGRRPPRRCSRSTCVSRVACLWVWGEVGRFFLGSTRLSPLALNASLPPLQQTAHAGTRIHIYTDPRLVLLLGATAARWAGRAHHDHQQQHA